MYLELFWGFPQLETAEAVLPDGSVPVAGGEAKDDGFFSAESPNIHDYWKNHSFD